MFQACGQSSLAYLTAETHGLNEEAKQIIEDSEMNHVPVVSPNAQLLKPPIPIVQAESNWPLLAMSKVSFLSFSSWYKNCISTLSYLIINVYKHRQ